MTNPLPDWPPITGFGSTSKFVIKAGEPTGPSGSITSWRRTSFGPRTAIVTVFAADNGAVTIETSAVVSPAGTVTDSGATAAARPPLSMRMSCPSRSAGRPRVIRPAPRSPP